MNKFSTEKLAQIKAVIDEVIESKPGPHYAAFDADGTLWDSDLGEALFAYQIANKLVPLPKDPWGHYNDLKQNVSFPAAYLWLAQINKGVPLKQVQAWAKAAVEEEQPVPILESQKEIIAHLKSRDVQVYIVTASVKWAVEPGAPLLGLTADDVIGITTKVDKNGLVMDEQDGPITFREGKVEAFLQKTNGTPPIFAAGNTLGDLPLLESSSAVRLAVAAMPVGKTYYESERELLKIAESRGWFLHSYI